MKKTMLGTLILLTLLPLATLGQTIEDNKSVTTLVLSELNRQRLLQRENLDFRIKEMDSKINYLDESIKNTNSSSEKVEKLLERVQILEEKQSELDKNVVSVYKYNYSLSLIHISEPTRPY